MKLRLAVLALLCFAAPAYADQDACKTFAWPLDEERAWFDSAGLKTLSAEPLPDWRDGLAYRVALARDVAYRMPPERKPKPEADKGAVVDFSAAAPGKYQVTLSDDAWIDVIQDSKYVASVEHTGVKGCPGLRKSVRFVLQGGPVILQLSGATAEDVALAIRKVE